jgi:hypothetical protein
VINRAPPFLDSSDPVTNVKAGRDQATPGEASIPASDVANAAKTINYHTSGEASTAMGGATTGGIIGTDPKVTNIEVSGVDHNAIDEAVATKVQEDVEERLREQ